MSCWFTPVVCFCLHASLNVICVTQCRCTELGPTPPFFIYTIHLVLYHQVIAMCCLLLSVRIATRVDSSDAHVLHSASMSHTTFVVLIWVYTELWSLADVRGGSSCVHRTLCRSVVSRCGACVYFFASRWNCKCCRYVVMYVSVCCVFAAF